VLKEGKRPTSARRLFPTGRGPGPLAEEVEEEGGTQGAIRFFPRH